MAQGNNRIKRLTKEWYSKTAPLYVWPGDIWIKEPANERYYANIDGKFWVNKQGNLRIPFHKNTKIFPADELSNEENV